MEQVKSDFNKVSLGGNKEGVHHMTPVHSPKGRREGPVPSAPGVWEPGTSCGLLCQLGATTSSVTFVFCKACLAVSK